MSIKILEIEQDDILGVLPLMRSFSQEYPLGVAKDFYSDQATSDLLFHVCLNGVGYVAFDGDTPVGIIAGIKQINPFTLSAVTLNEVCWFVKEDYRGTDVGIGLYKSYRGHTDFLLVEDSIQGATMTTLSNTPDSVDFLIAQSYNQTEKSYIRTKGDL